MKCWVVYLLKCSDDTIYTGITNNLEKRLICHNNGKGAKYTKTRRPVKLLKYFIVDSKSLSLRVEIKIKKLSRKEKLNLTLQDIENIIKEIKNKDENNVKK